MDSIFTAGNVQFINIKSTNTNFIDISDASVLIDEVHTFDSHDLIRLKNLLHGVPAELFVSMLPSSFSENILPNTKYLISRANLVISIEANCHLCGGKTSMSDWVKTKEIKSLHDEIIVGKSLFQSYCSKCKYKKRLVSII